MGLANSSVGSWLMCPWYYWLIWAAIMRLVWWKFLHVNCWGGKKKKKSMHCYFCLTMRHYYNNGICPTTNQWNFDLDTRGWFSLSKQCDEKVKRTVEDCERRERFMCTCFVSDPVSFLAAHLSSDTYIKHFSNKLQLVCRQCVWTRYLADILMVISCVFLEQKELIPHPSALGPL